MYHTILELISRVFGEGLLEDATGGAKCWTEWERICIYSVTEKARVFELEGKMEGVWGWD